MNKTVVGGLGVLIVLAVVGAVAALQWLKPGELPKASFSPAEDQPAVADSPVGPGRVTLPPQISTNHLPINTSASGVSNDPHGSESPTGGLDAPGPSRPPRDSFLPPAGVVSPPDVAPLEAELKAAPKDPFLR